MLASSMVKLSLATNLFVGRELPNENALYKFWVAVNGPKLE
jgi:hypothetical protein